MYREMLFSRHECLCIATVRNLCIFAGSMATISQLSDLYHAFLSHNNMFKEVKLFKFEGELSKVFYEVIEWLQELILMNETHPELRNEMNVLCNGQKVFIVAKKKLNKCYIVQWKFIKQEI